MTEHETPSDVVGRRIKELRKKRGWSTGDLAVACTAAGAGEHQLTESAIEFVESGRRRSGRRRRQITVDELLVLADALDTAPVHLIVDVDDDERPYQVTPGRIEPSGTVRYWIRGSTGLPGTDLRLFYSEVPPDEWDLFTAVRGDDAAAQALSREQLADRFQKVADRLRRREKEGGGG